MIEGIFVQNDHSATTRAPECPHPVRLTDGVVAVTLAALLCCGTAYASDEIQVYTDDINAPGEFGLELHTNYVIKGRRDQKYEGELTPHHVLNLTPEFSYGVTKRFEVGLYLPFAYDVGSNSGYTNGIKFRAKWLEAEETSNIYYGINFELARNAVRAAEDRWSAEIRPIFGIRGNAWSFTVNPILDVAVSGSNHRPQFEPAVKLNRKISGDLELGVEHYSSLGPLNDLAGAKDQSHATFLVADFKAGGHDFNIGIGRGWRNSDEQWTLKLIVGGINFLQ